MDVLSVRWSSFVSPETLLLGGSMEEEALATQPGRDEFYQC